MAGQFTSKEIEVFHNVTGPDPGKLLVNQYDSCMPAGQKSMTRCQHACCGVWSAGMHWDSRGLLLSDKLSCD